MIPGVKVVIPKGGHSDSRRDIHVVMNSQLDEFQPGQIKVIVVKQDAWLGGQWGHYHIYPETYMVIGDGKAVFHLQHSENQSLKQKVELTNGLRLTIPSRVAHKACVSQGTILIGLTKWAYHGPDQDKPFSVEDITD